jgi:hypothetical protein
MAKWIEPIRIMIQKKFTGSTQSGYNASYTYTVPSDFLQI